MHMSKMSITDAAEHFGVSKEAIHNRIRRGSLGIVIEDGVKMVTVDNNSVIKSQPRKGNVTQDNRYYKFLEEQNARLQDKVEKLENETRGLREQKEQMLIEERIKIEQIYKEKDEQLKNILNAISANFMLNSPTEDKLEKFEHVEAEIEDSPSQGDNTQLSSLKKYLKERGFSKPKRDKIKSRFKEIAKKDKRITVRSKKLYIDLTKYDYKDLL
jgi:hypothetical protein